MWSSHHDEGGGRRPPTLAVTEQLAASNSYSCTSIMVQVVFLLLRDGGLLDGVLQRPHEREEERLVGLWSRIQR